MNRENEVVGLIFDGNIESLVLDFGYDDALPGPSRSIRGHPRGAEIHLRGRSTRQGACRRPLERVRRWISMVSAVQQSGLNLDRAAPRNRPARPLIVDLEGLPRDGRPNPTRSEKWLKPRSG